MSSITLGINVPAARATRRVGEASRLLSNATTALSSGLRINKASDDAAGLAISSSLKLSSRVYSQAIRNANDGISQINIAEGALDSLSNITVRLKELAYQSMNGTVTRSQRRSLNSEAQALAAEYDRITQTTTFNGQTIFQQNGSTNIQLGFGTTESITVNYGEGLEELRGTGSYTQSLSYAISAGTDTINSGDFNNDGIVDIMRTRFGRIHVSLGNGNGTFRASISHLVSSASLSTTISDVTDVNGDSRLDVVTFDYVSSAVQVSLGNGNGTFLRSTTVVVGNTTYGGGSDLEARDINGDGNADLVLQPGAYDGIDEVRIYYGNGDGTFAQPVSYVTGNQPIRAGFGDINGDGIEDLLALGRITTRIYLGNGDGTFAFARTLGSAISQTARVGDLNNDGLSDIFADGNLGGLRTARVYLSNGDGTFRALATQAINTAGVQVFEDINNDGIIDVVNNQASTDNYVNIYLGNGDGTFLAGTTATAGTGPTYLVTAAVDINGDGVKELIQGQNSAIFNVFSPTTTYSFNLKKFNLLTQDAAASAFDIFDAAETRITSEGGILGSSSSRLNTALSNLFTFRTGLDDAASRIEDIDVATASAELVRAQILQQAANSILSQGIAQPEIALKLLNG